MAFQTVNGKGNKVTRMRPLGAIRKATSFDGFFLKIDPDCELILYDKETKEYFKVLKGVVKVSPEDDTSGTLFSLSVNLNNESQAELVGKDD